MRLRALTAALLLSAGSPFQQTPAPLAALQSMARDAYWRGRRSMPRSPLARLQKLCLALPEAHEVIAWGEPTFRVKNNRIVAPTKLLARLEAGA